MRGRAAALLLGLAPALAVAACSPQGASQSVGVAKDGTPLVTVTIASANGARVFNVELAKTAAQQQQGLMYRTDLGRDGGMLFYPHPAEGGAPTDANFWMKNTPTSLDIVFIRADGTIARIAENTVPFSEAFVSSGEPVAAVLELVGGRTSALGIAEGDKVTLPATSGS